MEGRGDAVITVSAPVNYGEGTSILGTVSCPYDSSLTVLIGVSQDQLIETLSVNPTSITLRNMIGDSADVRVTSNTR